MSYYTLGQRVRFTNPITRAKVPLETLPSAEGRWNDRHINRKWLDDPFVEEREGIIIGRRTLSNGHSSWESDDYGTGFYLYDKAEHFTAYLIAFDINRKPVHVLPEHITPMEES